MIPARVTRTFDRARDELESAFLEDHSSHEVAMSFSIGLFITALPTLGTGLLMFAVLVYLFRQLSKIAMLASVIVLNPFVKWGVYASSYWLGQRLLGPIPGISFDGDVLAAGPDVLLRLWVGNLILAVLFASVGYVIAHRLVIDFRQRPDLL
ncbi:DUF2062 domain-containing protein [Halobellus sp. GM3]|uniref:DUF2062 domain-containing protein n=1 Tax=Halobellus sp. GM3 TaxID=3458410 RepID=UPI00403D9FEF